MKTSILLIAISVFIALGVKGCQDEEEKNTEHKYRSLYLKRINHDGGLTYGGWRSGYCRYKVFEGMNRTAVIDTICIRCIEQDSAWYSCINERDYRFVWDQEYHPEDTSMTWRPLYIEKIPRSGYTDCESCPEGKRKFVQTFYGDMW
jgi:hypothetical protein